MGVGIDHGAGHDARRVGLWRPTNTGMPRGPAPPRTTEGTATVSPNATCHPDLSTTRALGHHAPSVDSPDAVRALHQDVASPLDGHSRTDRGDAIPGHCAPGRGFTWNTGAVAPAFRLIVLVGGGRRHRTGDGERRRSWNVRQQGSAVVMRAEQGPTITGPASPATTCTAAGPGSSCALGDVPRGTSPPVTECVSPTSWARTGSTALVLPMTWLTPLRSRPSRAETTLVHPADLG
jgi:hypothetical protein